MNKKLTVTLSVDAKTGEVTAVRNSFDKLDRKVGDVQNNLTGMTTKLVAVVGFTGAVYGLAKAFSFVVRSGFDYNKSMDASTAKLTAMISASKGYETTSGRLVSAQERQVFIAQEVEHMMAILKKTNAQTAMGMSELVDIYALAKPGMDRYNWAIQDQIEIVKLASNTASTFGMTAEELSSGIDDLAAGTWEASSGFGKMMKSIGVSKAEYQAAADKVAYLKEKMKKTGAAQDTWAVATSNLQVAWDKLAGQITQPIFDGVKEAIKYITTQMNTYAPDAMQVFSDALVGMVNVGVKSMGFLAKVINQVIGLMQIAYSGFQKAAGLVMGGDTSEMRNELAELEKQHSTLALQERRSLRQKIEETEKWNDLRREGDKNHEDALKRIEAINKLITKGVDKFTLKKGVFKDPIQEAIKPAEQLVYKLNKFDGQTKTTTKSLKAQAKDAEKALKAQRDLNREYLKLTGDKSGLFQLDVQETMQKFIDSGAYSAEQLSKIYDGMWDDYQDKAKESSDNVRTWLQEAFNIDGGTIGQKLFDNLWGSLQAFASAFSSKSPFAVNRATGDLLTSSLDTLYPGAGTAVKILGALLSNTLSEEEIRAAAGRSEFDSKGTSAIISTLEKFQQPQLTATESMLHHLTSMDNNLLEALKSVGAGIDLKGSGYTPQTSSVLGGVIFASSTELIGSGIKFYDQAVSGFTQGVEADGYQAIKETSSWFGIFTSESISESLTDLPSGVKTQIGEAFNNGLESAFDGLDLLGFNTDVIRTQIQDYVVSLGKIDFKDLTLEEQAKALNQALTQELNNALGFGLQAGDTDLVANLHEVAKAGEEMTATIARVAVGFETVSTTLEQFGAAVTTFTGSEALINAAGSLEAYAQAMDIFKKNFFTPAEQREMNRLALQSALIKQGVALPASKAEFKALVLGTQQKILAVQAQIDARKAEIRSMIENGKFTQKAVEEKAKMEKFYRDGMLLTGEAAVTAGNNFYKGMKNMTGAAQEAVSFDADTGKVVIDWSAIGDASLTALEHTKENLQGLLGTLTTNMGAFSDYYNDSVQVVSDAQQKLREIQQGARSLGYEWIGLTEMQIAQFELQRISKQTGLGAVTADTFYQDFTSALVSGIDDKDLEKWKKQSDAIQRVAKAREAENKALEDFKTSANNAFKDLFEDSIAELRSGLDAYIIASDYSGAMSSYNSLLDEAKQRNNNKIDYFLESARLNQKIQDLQPVNPNKGIEERLDKLNDAIERLELIEKDTSTACNATATSCNTTAVACSQTANNTAVIASQTTRYTIAPQSTTASYENGINYTGSAL